MNVLFAISLLVIALVWLACWRLAWRWTRTCGITDPISAVVVACILPTSGLLASVHVMALPALFFEWGCVTPISTCVVFGALFIFLNKFGGTSPGGVDRRDPVVEVRRVATCGWLWLPVAIIVAMYAVFFVDAISRYPTGYDARMYHLPGAVQWMQQRSLTFEVGAIHDSFPENGMIVAFLLAFVRLEWLLPLVHLPKGLLAIAAVFGLIRAVGFRRRTALMGACIAGSVPMVVFQSYSGYIDLYAASTWLASLLALVWAVRAAAPSQRRLLVIFAGLGAGICLGSKTTFLVLSFLLGLFAIGIEWLGQSRAIRLRQVSLRHGLHFALAALVCSGFWFVRGATVAGNPVYPLAVVVGDQEILPGYTADLYYPHRTAGERLERWWAYPWKETKYSGTGYPYSVNNATGAAYATFVVPGVVMALLLAVRRPRGRPHGRVRLSLLLITASGALLLLTVFHEMLRFVFPQLLLAVVVAAAFVERLSLLRPRATIGLLSASLAVTAMVATLRPVHAMAGRWRDRITSRASFYEIPPLVDSLPSGTRLLNLADSSYVYPLLGSNLSNRVINHCRWIDAHGEGALTEMALRKGRIEYVFVDDAWDGRWTAELDLVYDSSPQQADKTRYKLYKVTQPG